MTRPAPPSPPLPQLGRHHFAHLRAVAEGLTVADAAARFLGIEHGHEAVARHRTVVEQLRALARRRGDRAWRLVGLTIRLHDGAAMQPSLDEFIAERQLDGYSEAEVLELFREEFRLDAKVQRRRRLRERQLVLLRELEALVAQPALPGDPIAAWFEPVMAERLKRSGLLVLQDLQERIAAGGRWWRSIPAVGPAKARALAACLGALLSEAPGAPAPRFALPDACPLTNMARSIEAASGPPIDADNGASIGARTDAQAIEAWVAAKAGSTATACSYRRECRRLLLWLHQERGKGFAGMAVEDCLDYMAFLAHVPARWISRRQVAPLAQGWAPFRGQISVASRRQAVIVLGSFMAWLVATGYLPGRNPWLLVNRRTGDDRSRNELDTRAFTPQAWSAIATFLAEQTPSPSLLRMRFILAFVEATGLRSTELLEATLGALRRHKGRWTLQVHGKGARNRIVAVPSQAVSALADYLASRGLPALEQAPPDTPLLASTRDPALGISYSALYQTLKSWLAKAIRKSSLDLTDRLEAQRASPHWLRHTCGTRAIERGTPLDVVQQQFGHADPRTTARYSRAQLERIQDLMEAAFKG